MIKSKNLPKSRLTASELGEKPDYLKLNKYMY